MFDDGPLLGRRKDAGHVFLSVVAASLMLGACTKPYAKTWTYRCPDGYTFDITYSGSDKPGDIVLFEDVAGVTQLLRAAAASGAKYSNGSMTFWSKGDESMVLVGGEIRHQNCRIA